MKMTNIISIRYEKKKINKNYTTQKLKKKKGFELGGVIARCKMRRVEHGAIDKKGDGGSDLIAFA
jgi:hypothetical protein